MTQIEHINYIVSHRKKKCCKKCEAWKLFVSVKSINWHKMPSIIQTHKKHMRSFSMQSRLLSSSLLLSLLCCWRWRVCASIHISNVCIENSSELFIGCACNSSACFFVILFFLLLFSLSQFVCVCFFFVYNSQYWRISMVSQCTQIICKILYKQIHGSTKKKEQLYVLNANHFSVFPVNCRSRFLFYRNWWTKMQKILSIFHALVRFVNSVCVLCIQYFCGFILCATIHFQLTCAVAVVVVVVV